MPIDPSRMLTVTLPSDIWDHIIDRLGDYADAAEDRPWLGNCHDCDKAAPGMCPQHQEAAKYGAQVRGWRDRIVDQLGAQTLTMADRVRRTGLPLDTDLYDVLPSPYGGVRNLVMRAGMRVLGDLAAYSDADLTGIKNFGPGRLRELHAALREAAKS
ncbi:DNA-directed RNA polymerase subunit alpha C-terminal domain-containing protein [Nonomuraea wenchangensis]